uniref:Uncharacterized protein n=1 Tax=Anopheles farauti TaxID=69004 RepID=A0A182QHR1_9DIPT
MNSVFSAFKSSQSTTQPAATPTTNGIIGSTGPAGHHEATGMVLTNGAATNPATTNPAKLLLNIKTHRPAVADHPPNSSYEKLRHIREISCTNRNNNLVALDGLDAATSGTPEDRSVATTPVQSPMTLEEKCLGVGAPLVDAGTTTTTLLNGGPRIVSIDQVDHHHPHLNHLLHQPSSAGGLVVNGTGKPYAKADTTTTSDSSSSSSTSSSNSGSNVRGAAIGSNSDSKRKNTSTSCTDLGMTTPAAPLAIKPPSGASSQTGASANGAPVDGATPAVGPTARFHKPRLSLSNSCGGGGVASSLNTTTSMPSVHGRTGANGTNGTSGMPPPKTRLSTHQRNLSLDFR